LHRGVKHCLQLLNDRVGDQQIQDSVAVVDATCNEGMDKSVQRISWHRSANETQLLKLAETTSLKLY